MANSLRAKLKKLKHDGNITEEDYQELLKKLDGHDKKLKKDVVDEFAEYYITGECEYKDCDGNFMCIKCFVKKFKKQMNK